MIDYTLNERNRLPLTSDYVFKRIFGQEENKEALKDLIQSILNIKINDVQINNPEIPKNFYDSKRKFYNNYDFLIYDCICSKRS